MFRGIRRALIKVVIPVPSNPEQLTPFFFFNLGEYYTHAATKISATVVAGNRGGVVVNLDSATSPANFITASHDGTTARLIKCVAGEFTELIAVEVAYVAGAYVEVRRTLGTNTYQFWYNDTQVGEDQTIADAGIISNILHGTYNAFVGNILTNFSCALGQHADGEPSGLLISLTHTTHTI